MTETYSGSTLEADGVGDAVFSPAKTRPYLAMQDGVIDGSNVATQQPTATLHTGPSPAEIRVSPDEYIPGLTIPMLETIV